MALRQHIMRGWRTKQQLDKHLYQKQDTREQTDSNV
jgi:hypothetical protein